MRDRRKTFAWWRWRTGESRHVIHAHPMYTFPGDSCFLPDKDVSLLLLFSCSFVSDSFVTPWVVAHQAPLSTGFSQQEYWSGLPFPPPGDLPHPGIEPGSPALQADSLQLSPCRSSKARNTAPNRGFYQHVHLLSKCLWVTDDI